MAELVLAHEAWLRFGAFAAVLAAMALWEALAPRRAMRIGRRARWPANLGVVIVDTLVLRFAFPLLAVGVAFAAQARGVGLFNWLAVPGWIAGIASLLLLDLLVYGQHFALHHIRAIWPLHAMHHADNDIDVTTGVRFHPVEIALSMLLKLAAVAALGCPPLAVIVFEVLLNATSLFNHANIRMPAALDRVLRLVVVTPDMHRVHHSVQRNETDSNFGFNLPWWDWLFGTYRAQPRAGHIDMTIGLPQYQKATRQSLWYLLLLPFRRMG